MNFRFVGWCKEKKHDKIWGVIQLDNTTAITFWGRRGAKLQTKRIVEEWYLAWHLAKLIDDKVKKGYNEITNLEVVYPNFKSDLEKALVWASLTY